MLPFAHPVIDYGPFPDPPEIGALAEGRAAVGCGSPARTIGRTTPSLHAYQSLQAPSGSGTHLLSPPHPCLQFNDISPWLVLAEPNSKKYVQRQTDPETEPLLSNDVHRELSREETQYH